MDTEGEPLSPSQRYAAAQRRAAERKTQLYAFAQNYEFPFDTFQTNACQALEAGHSVLVAAPTGAGKTVVGEFAVHLAITESSKCFYTTPIKALSNQKYRELVEQYGADRVGLLTGDNSINGEAPVVVMTTEVLRNMIYEGSRSLRSLGYVVMDEVHYLADRFRGAVWEEVLIQLPSRVRVASLSATVSNAEEFGRWLSTVRGSTEVVIEEKRPVPLWQHVAAGNRLYDLFIDEEGRRVNPELLQMARDEARWARSRPARGPRGRRRTHSRLTPRRETVIDRLDRQHLLPAITFIFSRAGCDAAVAQCVGAGLRLTDAQERAEIRERALLTVAEIPPGDHAVLDVDGWMLALERGIAAHHAGMLPLFKETVEDLFQRGLLKAVFATETLALGINMPAKSVVMERLSKWNGEQHVALTAGEYTQMTGRAGRRGIDVEGHAIVVWTQELDPASLAGLASTRTYPLRSSFRPSYNMAVNLVRRMDRSQARDLLETSFAQFQADEATVGLAAEIRTMEEAQAGYVEAMACHLGDFAEYAQMRVDLGRLEKESSREGSRARREGAADALRELRRGDVVMLSARRRRGPAVVLDTGGPGRSDPDRSDDPRPLVMTVTESVRRVGVDDFSGPISAVAHIRVPKGFRDRSAADRRHLAERLREVVHEIPADRRHAEPTVPARQAEIDQLRAALRRHPCHGCHDREQHARWAERHHRLSRSIDKARRRLDRRTNTVARQFDHVCDVLLELGYLAGDPAAPRVTEDGLTLSRLYNENDLVAAQCLRDGLWQDLTAHELAAVCAALVYESREPEHSRPEVPAPRGRLGQVLTQMQAIHGDLVLLERGHQLNQLKSLDLGFCRPIATWAKGAGLEQVLWEAELTPGDFVRWTKQVMDLLDQVAQAVPDSPISQTAREAVAAIDRGVVGYTGLEEMAWDEREL